MMPQREQLPKRMLRPGMLVCWSDKVSGSRVMRESTMLLVSITYYFHYGPWISISLLTSTGLISLATYEELLEVIR